VHSFHYAGVEIEAFGGDVMFRDDGPPNAGEPIIKQFKDIDKLEVPDLSKCKQIQNVLEVTRKLNEAVGGKVIIVGVVMSPFSLPVMQLGFENYLKLMIEDKDRFNKLMDINKEFTTQFANMQLEAGANGIVYFDPVSSQTIITRDQFVKMGAPVMKEVIGNINGPVVVHYASGLIESNINELIASKAVGIGTSSKEDHSILKELSKGKITLVGNLNAIEMVNWDSEKTEQVVKDIIRTAGKGGGFILSDNHGELPMQVPLEVIRDIVKYARKHGKYPIG
jgi:uroporphyrinogen decarboxylase